MRVEVKAQNLATWAIAVASAGQDGPCIEWSGYLTPKGYGVYRRHGAHAVHRSIWIELNGPIADGLMVCHRCDNRRCLRPAHLFLGTAKDNSADMVAKGRSPSPRNERSGKARLTNEQVNEIRRLRASGVSCAALARAFGVHSAHVSRICNGLRRPVELEAAA